VPPSQQVPVPAQHRIRAYQQPHPAKRFGAHAVQQRRHKRPVRPGEPCPSPIELAFQDSNLMAEDQDLGGFVLIAQRKQAQGREQVR
jgi:3-hydroxymyristoyl/3-hydroxydecanoyl-(acyl carrier protein) dehydratase